MDDFMFNLNNESGQSLVEYSLILSLVVLAAFGAVMMFGDWIYVLYEMIKENVINAL